jgi:hypothetical protein
MRKKLILLALVSLLPMSALQAAEAVGALGPEVDRLAKEVEPKVIAWRRDIH